MLNFPPDFVDVEVGSLLLGSSENAVRIVGFVSFLFYRTVNL